MKEIKAYIRPRMLDSVVDPLGSRPDSPGLTVSDVQGWGHLKGEAALRLTERVKLEIVVPDDEVDGVVSVIVEKAQTEHSGDGKIFLSDVDHSIRIRTGEAGRTAVVPSGHPYDGEVERPVRMLHGLGVCPPSILGAAITFLPKGRGSMQLVWFAAGRSLGLPRVRTRMSLRRALSVTRHLAPFTRVRMDQETGVGPHGLLEHRRRCEKRGVRKYPTHPAPPLTSNCPA